MAIIKNGKHVDNGEVEQNLKGSHFTERFRVEVSSHFDDWDTVLAPFDPVESEHDTRQGFFLKTRKARREEPNSNVWEVELEYTTPGYSGNESGSGSGSEEAGDPTLEFPTIRKSHEQIEEPISFLYDSANVPYKRIIMSPAGEIYINPQMRINYICVIEIQKNFGITADDDALNRVFSNKVNSATYRGYPPGTVMLLPVSMERKQKTYDGVIVPYKSLTFTFKCHPHGWQLNLPAIGSEYIDPVNGLLQPFRDSQGNLTTGLLKLDGLPLCDQGGPETDQEVPCLREPVYMPEMKRYATVDFNSLNLPTSDLDFRGWNLG